MHDTSRSPAGQDAGTATWLSRNLSFLCSTQASVSEVCRRIGINRQQFGKYLSGRARPSARNRRAIAHYFGILEDELYLPPEEFAQLDSVRPLLSGFETKNRRDGASRSIGISSAFVKDDPALEPFLGYYHMFYRSPSWPGKVACAVIRWHREGGFVYHKAVERTHNRRDSRAFVSKFSGQVAFLSGRIYLVEYEALSRASFAHTCLFPPPRKQLTYMTGYLMGVTGHMKVPYACTCVWKYFGARPDLRKLISDAHLRDLDSSDLDPYVKANVGAPTALMDDAVGFDVT